MIEAAVAVAFLAVTVATLATGRHLKGRWSRVLIGRLGFHRTVLLRMGAAIVGLILTIVRPDSLALQAIIVGLTLWSLDDLLYRDPPERRRERKRVRLKMPKPVKLRPIERWSGA